MQPQKGKQGTKGAKQIVEENAATLKFYQYMAAGSTTIFFIINFLFFEFTGTVSVSMDCKRFIWIPMRRKCR